MSEPIWLYSTTLRLLLDNTIGPSVDQAEVQIAITEALFVQGPSSELKLWLKGFNVMYLQYRIAVWNSVRTFSAVTSFINSQAVACVSTDEKVIEKT